MASKCWCNFAVLQNAKPESDRDCALATDGYGPPTLHVASQLHLLCRPPLSLYKPSTFNYSVPDCATFS